MTIMTYKKQHMVSLNNRKIVVLVKNLMAIIIATKTDCKHNLIKLLTRSLRCLIVFRAANAFMVTEH